MEEENKKAKVAGVNVDLEPGGGTDEWKKRQFFARVEQGQAKHQSEQEKARIDGRFAQRNLQDQIQHPGNCRSNDQSRSEGNSAPEKRTHLSG